MVLARSSVVSLAVALLFATPALTEKLLSFDIEKTQITSTPEHVEHQL